MEGVLLCLILWQIASCSIVGGIVTLVRALSNYNATIDIANKIFRLYLGASFILVPIYGITLLILTVKGAS